MGQPTLGLVLLLAALVCHHSEARLSGERRALGGRGGPLNYQRLKRAAPSYYQQGVTQATCLTEACVRRGQRLLDAIDQEANPCENFGKYACGGRFLRDKSSGASESPTEYARRQNYINGFLKNALDGDQQSSWTIAEGMAQEYYQKCKRSWFTSDMGTSLYKALAKALGADHLLTVDLKTSPKTLGAMLRVLNEKFGVQLSPALTRVLNATGTCSVLIHDGDDYKDVDDDLDMAADEDIEEVESELGSGLTLAEDFTNKVKEICEGDMTLRQTTVRQLVRNAPEFGWPEFLDMDEKSIAPVYIQGCVLKLSKELSKFQLNYPMKLKSMLVGRAMRRLWKKLDDDADASDDCLTFTRKYFGDALTRMYISESKHALNLTGTVEMMMALSNTLIGRLERATWIDSNSRNFYLNKLKEMKFYMGYNEDIVESAERLEAHYFTVDVKGKLPGDLMRLAHWHYTTLQRRCDITLWDEGAPLEVTGYFSKYDSALVAPFGLLSGTGYDPQLPSALNYAALGADLGLLLMFTLDKDLRDTDQWGNKYNISKNTLAKLDKEEKCLTAHLQRMSSSDEDSETDYSQFTAELHGLKLAYEAWRATGGQQDELVPGISELYSPEQIFYITYAQTNCEKDPEDDSGYERATNTLSQIREVAKLWNCPVGSKLNPAQHCSVW